MKTNSILILICLCMGIVSACKTVNTYKVQDLNGKWTIVSVTDEPVTAANMPFLEFNVAEKRVHGNAGCNTLSAGFETDVKDATALKFVAPVKTMMACFNMETEAKIVQAINNVAHVKKGETPNRMKLVDKEGNALLVLERVKP